MTFDSYLQNLRAKPDHEKKRFAFWTSFGFTAIIFAFWIASFSTNLSTQNSVIAKADTPAQSLVASVSGFFGGIVDYFITPRTIEYSEVEVVAGDK